MSALAGIECKYIRGDEHAWNMVKINGKWYYLDSMWGYFLLGKNSITPDDTAHVHWDKFKPIVADKDISKTDFQLNLVPIYKIYNPNRKEHLFTASVG